LWFSINKSIYALFMRYSKIVMVYYWCQYSVYSSLFTNLHEFQWWLYWYIWRLFYCLGISNFDQACLPADGICIGVTWYTYVAVVHHIHIMRTLKHCRHCNQCGCLLLIVISQLSQEMVFLCQNKFIAIRRLWSARSMISLWARL